MTDNEKKIIQAYLNEPIENFELTAGRILLDAGFETTRAGVNEDEEAKSAARNFFKALKRNIKEVLCNKYKEKIGALSKNADKAIELVGYIAGILESHNIHIGPLNYIFISAWIIKNGLRSICIEEEKSQ